MNFNVGDLVIFKKQVISAEELPLDKEYKITRINEITGGFNIEFGRVTYYISKCELDIVKIIKKAGL